MLTLITWLSCLPGFSTLNLPFFLSLSIWGEDTMHSPQWRNGELLCSTSLRGQYLHKLFGILLHGRCVCSVPCVNLFISLYQYGLVPHYPLSIVMILSRVSFCIPDFGHFKKIFSLCLLNSLAGGLSLLLIFLIKQAVFSLIFLYFSHSWFYLLFLFFCLLYLFLLPLGLSLICLTHKAILLGRFILRTW